MTTLVTGAAGFLGSDVTRQLVARGEDVRVLMRASSNNRAISDLSHEDFINDFQRFLKPDGRFDAPRLVLSAFGHPVAGFGELIRLARRVALASKNLGEFLANCEF